MRFLQFFWFDLRSRAAEEVTLPFVYKVGTEEGEFEADKQGRSPYNVRAQFVAPRTACLVSQGPS